MSALYGLDVWLGRSPNVIYLALVIVLIPLGLFLSNKNVVKGSIADKRARRSRLLIREC
ncbi:hypothetical protein [Nostoc sp. MS1]|uniref:hypothetical protein n=1 Tax=Nostoc sp. MS1 TaxID=2764711 RepID=UPI001CC669E7|nr:hypothetical protein [Nostoc sp. MS1]